MFLVNELGYVSFGFEGGQQDLINAIENHTIFILLTMVFRGILGYVLIQIQIRLEENHLIEQHGDKYLEYKENVRRLI